MAGVGEGSSAAATSKPVVVRVKRKSFQSPIDAFWLEINERPLKRPLVDFANLSLSDSFTQKEELNTKKVFVQHVETVSIPDVTFDVVQHFMDSGSSGASECKSKIVERKELLKKDNKHDQLLLKAKEKHESTARNARFEQIWKSRRGNKESVHAKALQEICHFYDVVRVDEEKNNKAQQQQEHISLEDQRLLCSYLPLLKEFIPDAAVEIESDMRAHHEQDDYVYDIYTVNEEMDMTVEDTSYSYPLVQVDEDDDYYDGPQELDYESDDSNDENNPLNDYPDEISEGEDEEDNEDSDDDSDERESRNAASDESSAEEDFRHVFSKDDGDTDLLNDEDFADDYVGNHDVDGGTDDEEEEDGRGSYQ
ncbi:hypothetical protein QN277_012299 [Acacia crassicarpa]|uniref:Transcription factor Iwr1 domain-containing protein n=1 Tax=Acacia crassicarpa TaxID=499986 RepID=A0AAE1TEF6_9FABA|nr:hypothetical protein QN277_012299 [Acacia crassicarpa]